MDQKKLFVKGPFIFRHDNDPAYFYGKINGSAFIMCAYSEDRSEQENVCATIGLYKDIKRTGFRFLTLLYECFGQQAVCFAIPKEHNESDIVEMEKMLQWLAYFYPQGWLINWDPNATNNVWNEHTIIGYRIPCNAFQAGRLRNQGELC